MSMMIALLRDQKAATAIEYALIASLLSIMIIGGATAIGVSLNAIFQAVANAFK